MRQDEGLVTVANAAETFGVAPQTFYVWRQRYDNFPDPAVKLNPQYHLYRMSDLWDWYGLQWPNRVNDLKTYLHKFVLDGYGLTSTETVDFGPMAQAQGYLKAIRDSEYNEWRVWSTKHGFVAEYGDEVHIWALDPMEEPQEWFIYQQRYKAVGRREK